MSIWRYAHFFFFDNTIDVYILHCFA
jgi:hypothetical protein